VAIPRINSNDSKITFFIIVVLAKMRKQLFSTGISKYFLRVSKKNPPERRGK
jgi:hypothetical protein